MLFLEAFCNDIHLHAHDVAHALSRENVEENYLIETVEEFRSEEIFERVHHLVFYLIVTLSLGPRRACSKTERRHAVDMLRTDVGRHDDDRVFEVDRPPLRIGKAAVVEYLQENVEDFRMRFLYLVEEDDRIRPVTHELCQPATLIVSYVSGGRPNHF